MVTFLAMKKVTERPYVATNSNIFHPIANPTGLIIFIEIFEGIVYLQY
jgi:hypothetical protein